MIINYFEITHSLLYFNNSWNPIAAPDAAKVPKETNNVALLIRYFLSFGCDLYPRWYKQFE